MHIHRPLMSKGNLCVREAHLGKLEDLEIQYYKHVKMSESSGLQSEQVS